jgi:hypothetical protein
VSVKIEAESVPDYYWQVVPTRAFVSADLSRYIVRDESRYEPILQETRPLGKVTINNNVVVNNVVNVTYVERQTNEKVVVHQVENAPDASTAGKLEGAAVEVFRPAPGQLPKVAAPSQPKKIEEVALQTKTKEQGVGKPSTDDLLIPPEIKKPLSQASSPPPPLSPQEAGAPLGQGDKQKNAKGETQPGGPPGMQSGMAPPLPPLQQAEGAQGGKQKKAKGQAQPGGPLGMQPGMAPPLPQQAEGEQGGKQKKAKGEAQPGGPGMQPGTAPLAPPQQAEGEQGGKQKKAKGEAQPGGPPGMQPDMAPLAPPEQAEGEQGGKPKKGGSQPRAQGMQPGMAPATPPHEAAAPTSKPEKKGKKGGPPCREGTVRLENGTCAPAY